MTKRFIGDILMFILWMPFFASSIDTFVDFTFIGNKVTQLTWLVSIGCSIFVFIQKSSPIVIKQTFVLAMWLSLYGVIHLIFGQNINTGNRVVPTSEYLVGIVSSMFPLFFIYYFSYKGYITEDTIRKWSVLFIITVIFSYFNSIREMRYISDLERYTNNIGYVFLRSLPFLFFWYRKPVLQYVIFILYGLFIINSLKRGPILIWLILFIIYAYNNLKTIKKQKYSTRLILYALPVFVLSASIYYINNELINNEGLMNRLNATIEGNDSGRTEIYSTILKIFCSDSNLFQIIFGHGADSTLSFLNIHAHNDWLELLMNQGFIGVVLYLFYYIAIFKQIRKTNNPLARKLLFNIFIIILFTSIFSMSYMAYDSSIHIIMGYGIYRSCVSTKRSIG